MKVEILDSRLKHIIQSAEHVFFEKGFSKTTVSDICKVANCSRTTLYQHFDSKENIYLAVVNHSFKHFHRYFTNLNIKENNGLETMVSYAKGYINYSKQSPKRFLMLHDFYTILKNVNNKNFQSNTDKKLSQCRFFEQVKQSAEIPPVFLSELIQLGQQDGSINPNISASVLFLNYWAYLIGSANLFYYSNTHQPIHILGIDMEDVEQNTFDFIRKILS